jgi:hypothetical protein
MHVIFREATLFVRSPSFAMILLRRTGALCRHSHRLQFAFPMSLELTAMSCLSYQLSAMSCFSPSPQREGRRRENTQLLSLK